ncbi:MAG TPA: BatA and WFA domain-containing protein, partial [Clostridia bacterium]
MTLVTPLGLVGLIAVPLIIILYIMKQKREKVVVSSHILWQKVLHDMQAATPWQKLRKNLLMFLQILCAVLVAAALSGLALKSGANTSQPVIIAVDSSLSMSSTDIKPTRLDAAKKDAQKYAGDLPPGTPVTVVNLNREPDVLLYGSDSENEIRSGIESIEQTKTYTDVRRAEELLLSLKNRNPEALIVLFSDMPIRAGNEEIQFSNYKKQNDNVAVVRFTHAFREDGITAMSILRNQGDSDSEVSVSLYGDDNFIDSQLVTVPKNGTRTVWWSGLSLTVQNLHCVIDTEDILEADNHAYDTVYSGKPVNVLLVTQGNYFLEKIFSVIEGIEFTRTLPDEL